MPTKQICGSNELSERCIAQGGWDGPIHSKLCVLAQGEVGHWTVYSFTTF